ncbi:hypothetical protein O3M35_011252 [Rhynocoris fuscipes]|uniref:E3 ubiquitin-protein ligase parkin n=1 Tax=Rhynocoris fuscipes TaxID=488301 RepID=A0AAW1CXE9_9HEMI
MFIFDFLLSLWYTITHLLYTSRNSITHGLNIYIKSNKGKTLSVDVDPKWDIKNVKEVISPRIGLPPEDMEIIFAGKVLDDSTVIEDCDLGEKSTLHLVTQSGGKRSVGSRPLNQIVTLDEEEIPYEEDNEISQQTSNVQHSTQFYVYCSNCRGGPKQGKLRVRCAECGSGAFTVDRDPASWQDVLQANKISGSCQQEGCKAGVVSWAQFYFRCGNHSRTGEDDKDEAVSLYLIKSNTRNVPCLACTDILNEVLVFPCSDGHTICLPCFTQYCTSRLRERRFIYDSRYGYTLPCPIGCPDSFIAEPHHFRILPDELFNMYQRFGTEECVLKTGGVLCPQPNCGAGIMAEEDCTRIKCYACQFVFCRKCLQGYHKGDCETVDVTATSSSLYSVDTSKAVHARWDEASRVTIKTKTKPCPKCRTPTERTGGCMHMVCTRCDFEWCWVCQIDWTRECMGSHWFEQPQGTYNPF